MSALSGVIASQLLATGLIGTTQLPPEPVGAWLAGSSLAPWLAALAIRTSVLLAIALVLVTLLRRRSAALRHWLLAAAIGCALAMPMLALIVPAWNVPVLSSPRAAALGEGAGGPPGPAFVSAEERESRSQESFARWFALAPRPQRATLSANGLTRQLSSPEGIIAIWLAGVGLMLLPLIVGYARLVAIAQRSRRITSGRWRVVADDVAREVGLRRPIALLRSRHPSMLVTWGLAHPRVLLPASAAHWPDHTLRIVFLHELAHAKRGDWAIQMAAELLRALCWFNPLAWIACRRLRRESELACDDAVLSRGVDRTDYAAQLLDVARSVGRHRHRLSAAAVATPMAHPSGLEWRIRMMLNDRLNRAPLTRSARLATAVALMAIALPLAGFGAARQNTAAITSTVVDQSGAPVTDAEVTLTSPGRESRSFTPDAHGQFVADGLAAGPYVILVKATGFAPAAVSMTLAPDQRIEHRIRLTVGSVRETIVVRGANPSATDTRPEADVRLDQTRGATNGLQPPIFVTHVRPEYPARLHDAGVQGTVTLEGRLSTDGTITHISAVAPTQPELEPAARAAVEQWRYVPTYLHGVPIEIAITIVIEFQQ